MSKREKNLKAAKSHHEEEENEQLQLKPTKSPIVLSSDDEEANEDLSLKIVEKAMLRACSADQRNDAALDEPKSGDSAVAIGEIDLSSSLSQEAEAMATDVKSEKKSRKERKKKNQKMENPEETVVIAKEDEKAETCKAIETNKIVETNPVEISDNIVLRKLLRGPRYFDPPDSGWGACYNCGEEGHTTVNCTSARRKKPCFVCGSLEHNVKQCTKGQDCFICQKGGHRAKDCPERHKRRSLNFKMCLKCGDTGHDMVSCKNDYTLDDLKEIRCYICKRIGHLCCADFTDTGPRELSCYRCGQLGHSGLGCTRSHGEATSVGSLSSCFKCGEGGHFARECTSSTKDRTRSRGEITSLGLLSSCFKCGEGGHFARECTSSTKDRTRSRGETTSLGLLSSCFKCGEGGHFARECTSSTKFPKRNVELSTPRQKFPKENSDHARVRSAPSDPGKARKRKKGQYEGGGFTTPANSKRRGGWITEDPGDLSHGKAKVSGWGSPVTPNNKRNKTYTSGASGHASGSRPSRTQKLNFGASASNGSSNFYQHRHLGSRFGDSSNDWMRRNYDW